MLYGVLKSGLDIDPKNFATDGDNGCMGLLDSVTESDLKRIAQIIRSDLQMEVDFGPILTNGMAVFTKYGYSFNQTFRDAEGRDKSYGRFMWRIAQTKVCRERRSGKFSKWYFTFWVADAARDCESSWAGRGDSAAWLLGSDRDFQGDVRKALKTGGSKAELALKEYQEEQRREKWIIGGDTTDELD
jgi:hypothetical protein